MVKKTNREGNPGRKRAAVVQTGGPSAVINSSLAGIVEGAKQAGWELTGYCNAFEGLLSGMSTELNCLSGEEIARLRKTPGAYLGSSRLFLTEEIFAAIPRCLVEAGHSVLLMIGGNGTMYAADKIRAEAREQGLSLRVIGIPKTVDNDLFGIEYAPGFGSAARYVAETVCDIGMDLASMKTFEQIRIVEVMGRSAGWLAAASGLAAQWGVHVPHGVYLPEHAFDKEAFLTDIQGFYKKHGFALVVVGEGIHDKQGAPIGQNPFAALGKGSQIFGGASAHLSHLVAEKTGLRCRAIDLNMPQRCASAFVSEVDEHLAFSLGRLGADAMASGEDGIMVSISPRGEKGNVPLSSVGGKEKCVPEAYYDKEKKTVTPVFLAWLAHITGTLDKKYLVLGEHAQETKVMDAGNM